VESFFSAETLKQKRNDEIKVRVGEEKENDERRVFCNNASVMSFVEFLFVMLNR
jgi:hypothetical protein